MGVASPSPFPPPSPRPQSGALQEFPINNFQLHLTIHSQFLPPRAPSGWSAAGLVPPTPSPRTSRARSEGRAPSSGPGRFCPRQVSSSESSVHTTQLQKIPARGAGG